MQNRGVGREAGYWILTDAELEARSRYESDEIRHSARRDGEDHQEAYSDDDGNCTNQAESFFSRIRRAEIGMHHHVAGPYLANYALEMAWRENARRIDNGTQVLLMALAGLTTGPSSFQGYWQRHRRHPSVS